MTETRRFLAMVLAACLWCAVGCGPAKPSPTWNVSLVRPDGVVHRTFVFRSLSEPHCVTRWGGHTELYVSNLAGNMPTGRIAPVGWLWESERATDGTNE